MRTAEERQLSKSRLVACEEKIQEKPLEPGFTTQKLYMYM